MGARRKLNEAHVVGSLGLAGFLGFVTGSWLVFAMAGASLLAASLATGDIRPGKGRRK
jgi:hypothetical protein